MREVFFKPLATEALMQLCDYVEAKNTPGSGYRFQKKILDFIALHAGLSLIKYPLCHNPKLAHRNFSCLVFQKKWIIAFRYTQNTMTVFRIILGSKLR